jgi:Cellulose biosynthesis protein BcsS
MWRGVGVVAGAVLALALRLCGVAIAETATTSENDTHFLFFSGGELWREGATVHGGVLWSPDGLSQEGFTFKLLLAGGTYRYRSDEIIGQYGLVAAMPGWRFKHDRFEAVIYLGLDAQDHRLVPDDPSNRLRGVHTGVRAGMDLWFEPVESVMFSTAWSASTIGWNFWSRAQAGVRIPGLGWIGPELHALGDLRYPQQTYHQYRAGVHLTGFRTNDYEWSFGAGYVADTDRRTGAYGRIGLNVRR